MRRAVARPRLNDSGTVNESVDDLRTHRYFQGQPGPFPRL